jgi:hypothetical protein
MTIESTRRAYIIDKLYKTHLYNNIIPTSDEILSELKDYEKTHLDLKVPLIKYKDTNFSIGSESSASKMNIIKDTLSEDISIATKELYNLSKKSQSFYDRWIYEFNRLNRKAMKLENEVDSLLLLNQDTAGFFAHVSDNFMDMNKIDTANTTTKINIYENSISINPEVSEKDSSGGGLIDLSHLTKDDISFYPISKRKGTTFFSTSIKNPITNIFSTSNSKWIGKIQSTIASEMITELKINLKDTYNITKVSMNFDSTFNSKSNVTLQYSKDGYSWNLVPTSNATISLTSNNVWFFDEIEASWLKIIFYKSAPDNSDNYYIYTCSSIKVYGESFEAGTNNVFYSKSLSALDQNNNNISFSKVALDTCEITPEDTYINYYISASIDNSIWTDWIAIAPTNSKEIYYPKIINIGGITYKTNEDSNNYSLINTTTYDDLSQKKIINTFDSDITGYRFKNSSFGMINTAIPILENEDPNIISNSIVVWRNVRDTRSASFPDSSLVRNTHRGWGIEGSKYYCYFEIIDNNGLVIDFGNNQCEIDSKTVKGVVNIPVGIHKFSTKKEYWLDISGSITETITTEEKLKAIDLLYPYNHKLLIEGFPYLDSFKGNRLYKGTNISAQYYCNKISIFDLENNIDTLGSFSVKSIKDGTDNKLAVVLRYDTTNSDYINELCTVKWKSGISGSTSMYKYVKLKALLNTENSYNTPIFNSYRVKLGI